MSRTLPAIALVLAGAPALRAQTSRDTLRLRQLEVRAAEHDPRGRQVELLAEQTALRLKNIDAERLPALTVSALGQYQSDVLTLPIQLPGGQSIPTPPHDTYDAHVEAQQRLIDPSAAPRRAVERARLAESQAKVRTAIYAQRRAVDDAFFDVLRLQSQRADLETAVTDLEAQLRVAEERVRLRSALPSEADALRAELLRRRQAIAEVDANRRAALDVLSALTGVRVDANAVLLLPELAAHAAQARAALDSVRARPEYEQFARARESLARQEDALSAQEKPRISAFGRAGYGRPGLNPINDRFDRYWIAGVQLQWTPWSWGAVRRDAEALALQRQIVSTEEAAFTDETRRTLAATLATIDRLEATRASDDEIITLRERIAAETALRYREGVVTSAEYVDRQTDVLSARLARTSHHVELEQARARLLTLVGLEAR